MRGVGVTTAAPAGATISSGRQMTQARALVPVGLPGKVVSGRLQRSREATTSVPSSRASRLCVRASSGTLGEVRGSHLYFPLSLVRTGR